MKFICKPLKVRGHFLGKIKGGRNIWEINISKNSYSFICFFLIVIILPQDRNYFLPISVLAVISELLEFRSVASSSLKYLCIHSLQFNKKSVYCPYQSC